VVTDETWISAADRIALLRHGIVPVEVDATRRWVGVTGYGEDRVREVVGRRLGRAVTVDVLGNVPWSTARPERPSRTGTSTRSSSVIRLVAYAPNGTSPVGTTPRTATVDPLFAVA
jgi:hypothetical protein